MKRIMSALKRFFLPSPESPLWLRLLPYVVLGVLTVLVLISGAYAWEYTNSPEFCGTVCHTMPPEYTSYLSSPHARVDCVECHIGRGFIATRITRKAGDVQHIISLLFKQYEFPIRADELRPARETCERCHFPEKFSDDSLREIISFGDDIDNTPTSTYLIMKTGGGTARQGLGRGIHWHIENQVFFYAEDHLEQDIPYIRVIDLDGEISTYLDIESDIDPQDVDTDDLKEMDCITCHNRITHLIYQPEDAIDQLLATGVISPDIPEIRRKAVEVLRAPYEDSQFAHNGIAGLDGYYQLNHPDFYNANQNLVEAAITALQQTYTNSVFPEQKAGWDTHLNNIGHQYSPGCFRCHDGKHLNAAGEAVRLECNLCHSIPVLADAADFVADIEINRGPEPQSHLNPNWIALHRDLFDDSCSNCHTTSDPGGTSDTSFCSNSACHGNVYEYAGFDAPGLREILFEQIPAEEISEPVEGPITFSSVIGALMQTGCGACHGEGGIQGLDLTTYEGALTGGVSGAVIVPGDPDNSPLIQIQSGDQNHFGQFSTDELDLVREWISSGAQE